MVKTMPTNIADAGKRPGDARKDDMRQATVTLTPTEVRAIQHTISRDKAGAVLAALKEAGLVAASKAAKGGADRGAVSFQEFFFTGLAQNQG